MRQASDAGLYVSSVTDAQKAVVQAAAIADGNAPDYAALRAGAILLRICAVLTLVVGVYGILEAFVDARNSYGSPASDLLAAVTAIVTGLITFALSSACDALRDIAQNSFRTADAVQHMKSGLQARI